MSKKIFASLLIVLLIASACATASQTEAPAEDVAIEVEAVEEAADKAAEESSSESTEGMASESAEAVTYLVDNEASRVVWNGAKPIGSSHQGIVDIMEGMMVIAGQDLVESLFVIDMTTIISTDGSPQRLINHLKSEDFFEVQTFPTASLVIKSAEPTDVDNQYLAIADLTIKEITNEITFITDVTMEEGSITATSDIIFDRALFDVRYGSGFFFDNLGDNMINDEVILNVTLVANS